MMVNVGKYSIHGAFGIYTTSVLTSPGGEFWPMPLPRWGQLRFGRSPLCLMNPDISDRKFWPRKRSVIPTGRSTKTPLLHLRFCDATPAWLGSVWWYLTTREAAGWLGWQKKHMDGSIGRQIANRSITWIYSNMRTGDMITGMIYGDKAWPHYCWWNPLYLNSHLVGGLNPSEKYDFVSWDDDIPKSYGKIKNVPNHQPVIVVKVPHLVGSWICRRFWGWIVQLCCAWSANVPSMKTVPSFARTFGNIVNDQLSRIILLFLLFRYSAREMRMFFITFIN